MRQWWIFVHKELLELWRTKKLLLIGTLFLVIGILNPLTAKLTPLILEQTLGHAAAQALPKPTSLDAWAQFDKNVTQIGIYLFALIFSQTIQQERQQKQLVPLLVKGLKRNLYILAKFSTLIGCWFLSIGISFGITYGYTSYYFPDDHSPHAILAVIGVFLFGLVLCAMIVFASTLATQSFGGILGVVTMMVLFYVIQFFDQLKAYSPYTLLTKSAELRVGTEQISTLLAPFLVSLVMMGLLLIFSITILKRSKL